MSIAVIQASAYKISMIYRKGVLCRLSRYRSIDKLKERSRDKNNSMDGDIITLQSLVFWVLIKVEGLPCQLKARCCSNNFQGFPGLSSPVLIIYPHVWPRRFSNLLLNLPVLNAAGAANPAGRRDGSLNRIMPLILPCYGNNRSKANELECFFLLFSYFGC